MPIRLLIADRDPIFREGFRRILSRSFDAEMVETDTAIGIQASAAKTGIDLALVDATIETRIGLLSLVKQLRVDHPDLKVLIVGPSDALDLAVRSLRAGAGGYLPRGSEATDVVAAVQRVSQGRRFIPDTVAERLAEGLGREAAPPHESLSDREYEVLQLLVAGHTGSEVAKKLGISPKTVSTHRTRVLGKLGLRNNADLVRYAAGHGLRQD